MDDKKKPPDIPDPESILAAMFTAGVMLSGTGAGLETFASGWSTGFKACLECLGRDWRKNVGAEAVGDVGQKETIRRIIAGGCMLVENYDREQEYWAKQELSADATLEREGFLDTVMKNYKKYSQKRQN